MHVPGTSLLLWFSLGCGVLPAMSPPGNPFPPPAVRPFDLERFLGRWYEIVRLPHRFERDLDEVTAVYSRRTDNRIEVENSGVKPDGQRKRATGKAKFAGDPTIGHLRVSFFWIFYADYIVAALDPDYQWAVVVSSSKKYFWILARTPQLDEELLASLIARAGEWGIDTSRIIRVRQTPLR